jgi:hypothetical protein
MLALLKAQHESFKLPAISPLTPFLTQHSIDLVVDTTNATIGLAKDKEMVEKKVAGFISREHRDNTWKLPLEHLHTIGAFLMKLFKGDAALVGEYGFTVNITPKVIKTREIKIAYTQNKLNVRVALGSEIMNSGKVVINIYKGKMIDGLAITLGVGKKWIVTKGYGFLSFDNPSDTEFGNLNIAPPIV